MRSTKSYKIAGAAALALTLGFSPLSDILPGSAPTASAAAVQQEKSKAWDLELKHAPFKKNGVVFVPVKELSEYLDLQITTSTDKKFMYINSPGQSVRIAPGQSKALNAKGTPIAMGAAPVVRGGITYVPAVLLAKSFGMPVTWKGKSILSVQAGPQQYASTAVGNTLFWLNKETRKLSIGQAGSLPKPAGTISVKDLDWLSIKARKVSASSFVVDVENYSGEPHVHESRGRALIHDGKIVKQGVTGYFNTAGRKTIPDVNGYKGNVAIVNGSTLQLVNPTGKVAKTYDLAAVTGVQDDFTVEAIESDFLLVRPYKTATLFIIHPESKKSALIYKDLLDEEARKMIEEYPSNELGFVGDGLTWIGYKDKTLTFKWDYDMLNQHKTLSYKLPF